MHVIMRRNFPTHPVKQTNAVRLAIRACRFSIGLHAIAYHDMTYQLLSYA